MVRYGVIMTLLNDELTKFQTHVEYLLVLLTIIVH